MCSMPGSLQVAAERHAAAPVGGDHPRLEHLRRHAGRAPSASAAPCATLPARSHTRTMAVPAAGLPAGLRRPLDLDRLVARTGVTAMGRAAGGAVRDRVRRERRRPLVGPRRCPRPSRDRCPSRCRRAGTSRCRSARRAPTGALMAITGGWMSCARMNRFSRPEPLTEATSTKYVLPASLTKSTLDVPPARLPRSQRMMLALRDRALEDGDRGLVRAAERVDGDRRALVDARQPVEDRVVALHRDRRCSSTVVVVLQDRVVGRGVASVMSTPKIGPPRLRVAGRDADAGQVVGRRDVRRGRRAVVDRRRRRGHGGEGDEQGAGCSQHRRRAAHEQGCRRHQ